ncbi:MAG: ATP-dependent DNA helicase RecG [Gammaproteobacteria bacterium]|nr:ATP-dependent DNA helicase RecG [Gammaproteobacteria bacterium]
MTRTDSPASDPAEAALRALPGVGPRVCEKLARLGIFRIDHLLLHLPRAYEDRTRVISLDALRPNVRCMVEGIVQDARVEFYRGRRLRVKLADDSSGMLELCFMRFSPFQQEQLVPGARVRCFGEVKLWRRTLRMFHPEYELVAPGTSEHAAASLTPVYPATEGLAQISLRKLIRRALEWAEAHPAQLEHPAWEDLFRKQGLPGFTEALRRLHEPEVGLDMETLLSESDPARQRLIVEELAAYHLSFIRLRSRVEQRQADSFPGGDELIRQFLERLPFQLTQAQERVIEEIRQDLTRNHPMMRLLQGDVGSGKTIVALVAALCVTASDAQVAVMAPTELLAEQHYRSFWEWLLPLNIPVAFLSSSQTGKQRAEEKARIRSHRARIVIGTHALIQEDVSFDRLGLLIIDEQHRFGVHQRLALRRKGEGKETHPHQLIMTATPIPRSLAMTFYADLDASILDEMPPGRKPVKTAVMAEDRRDELMERIREACREGRQAYWVCTLVEESEALQCEAAESTWQRLCQALPELEVGLVHGRMKAPDKDRVMQRFKSGEVQLLVATTVIEVGVDVPNASLMVVENAERLGLAQLHQLRGRVGRSSEQSSCVLLYKSPLSENARTRIQIMRETTDGFEIAQRDLHLRGPGQLLGVRQAGEMVFRVADLSRDEQQLKRVQRIAQDFIRKDPEAVEPIMERWLGDSRRLGSV